MKSKAATLKTYIDLRDELWAELTGVSFTAGSPERADANGFREAGGSARVAEELTERIISLDTAPALVTRHASQVTLLELGNKVVRTLLSESKEPNLLRALELLRCDVCDSWIVRVKRELRAFQHESPYGPQCNDPEFIRQSLNLALGQA